MTKWSESSLSQANKRQSGFDVPREHALSSDLGLTGTNRSEDRMLGGKTPAWAGKSASAQVDGAICSLQNIIGRRGSLEKRLRLAASLHDGCSRPHLREKIVLAVAGVISALWNIREECRPL
jgi:hypothetical protein